MSSSPYHCRCERLHSLALWNTIHLARTPRPRHVSILGATSVCDALRVCLCVYAINIHIEILSIKHKLTVLSVKCYKLIQLICQTNGILTTNALHTNCSCCLLCAWSIRTQRIYISVSKIMLRNRKIKHWNSILYRWLSLAEIIELGGLLLISKSMPHF